MGGWAGIVSKYAVPPYRVGGTDVAVADGGTGASTAADARTNFGLVIGTDVEAKDADLTAIAALVSAADKLPYATGAQAWALAAFTAAGRALVDDADAAAQRVTLGAAAATQEAAAGLSFGTGWQNYASGYVNGTYYKDAFGIVHLEGLVYRASGTDSTIATLPAGYRPAASHLYGTVGDALFASVNINLSGIIALNSGAAVSYLSLSGFTFRVY